MGPFHDSQSYYEKFIHSVTCWDIQQWQINGKKNNFWSLQLFLNCHISPYILKWCQRVLLESPLHLYKTYLGKTGRKWDLTMWLIVFVGDLQISCSSNWTVTPPLVRGICIIQGSVKTGSKRTESLAFSHRAWSDYLTSVNGIPFGTLSEHNEFDFGGAGDPLHCFSYNRNIYCVTQWAGLNSSNLWFYLQLSHSYTFSNVWYLHFIWFYGKGIAAPKIISKPVYCNMQIPWGPLVWISENWDGWIWKNTKI